MYQTSERVMMEKNFARLALELLEGSDDPEARDLAVTIASGIAGRGLTFVAQIDDALLEGAFALQSDGGHGRLTFQEYSEFHRLQEYQSALTREMVHEFFLAFLMRWNSRVPRTVTPGNGHSNFGHARRAESRCGTSSTGESSIRSRTKEADAKKLAQNSYRRIVREVLAPEFSKLLGPGDPEFPNAEMRFVHAEFKNCIRSIMIELKQDRPNVKYIRRATKAGVTLAHQFLELAKSIDDGDPNYVRYMAAVNAVRSLKAKTYNLPPI
ncbi:hypothetical protein ACTVZO_00140 [Streptomyces sp. IBSNAI002]|uniref:hypothetical protein n=1 Tax=Streptomyces sp. IBSNAI002 TaxID=3457500 RepID=UPI003FCFC886